MSIWFTYWFMCCVCDSCIVVDYNHSGSKYNDNTPCRDFPFPVVVSWRFYAWMLELMQGFSLKELSISVLQSFNSLCLLQGFSECCPVRNIFARTWGPCEAAIPVSILNRSQTGIKCRKLYHIVRFCSMLEFIWSRGFIRRSYHYCVGNSVARLQCMDVREDEERGGEWCGVFRNLQCL